MDDSQKAGPNTHKGPAPGELGRRYAALLEGEPVESPAPEFDDAPTETASAPPSPTRILEALLFVGGAPLTAARAADAIHGLTPAQFAATVDGLNQAYRRQGRPYIIQPSQGGYALTLRAGFRPVLEKLYGSAREVRLSPAAIDVLALVAYRQPATKQEIDAARGAESGSVLRQLVRRGIIAVMARGESGGREVSYGTTHRFLEVFGLSSLDDLPQAQDLHRL